MSVLEVAQVTVQPGHEADFEADLLQAAHTVLPRSGGFIEFTGHGWGIERPLTYLFTIRWETLADHLEGFRGSALFDEWRALIGPHFDGIPVVEHFGV
ncbi:MAG: antibiotic biosynthesis monooxygenase [Actinobacteria bacterium]|mgnify:CR=1 FL=1|jgi:heme-degrading monooxygenase HmoA|nr:antibiotic biosynthesis monooxygenase [Actinomycetota bacterium]